MLGAFSLALVALFVLAAAAPAQNPAPQPTTIYATGQGGKVVGIIVSRNGDDMLVRDEDTKQVSWVTLVDDTRISSPTGFLRLDRKSQDATSLKPGLILTVHGSGGERGNLIAHRISFRRSALRVASQINAGEVELAARQEATADSLARATGRARIVRDSLDASLNALNKRLSELDAYDVKDSAVVTFATNSAELDPDAKTALADIVSRGRGSTGYVVEVAGFADITGPPALNQRLSQQRADAVVAYLTQVSQVPVRRIPNPVGLGTSRPVASNDTADGRARNRRVEVKLLLNRGLAKP